MEVNMTTATATRTEEIQQPQANPYNANKKWDNSNKDAKRGIKGANDSLAYRAPRKEAVISNGETTILEEEKVTTDTATTEATSVDDTYKEEPNDKFKKVDFKKRYDDLKKHYDRKLGDWKSKETSLKAEMLANRPTYTAPKTPEELATFREDYPDVYDVVETVAHMRAEEQLSDLQSQVQKLSEKEGVANRRAAEQELLNLHPDFTSIRESEEFHDWARVQPEAIQSWIYENNGDATLASRAIDLYKQDVGITTSKAGAVSKKTSPQKDTRGSAADAVSVKTKVEDHSPQEKLWTTSEIANLSVDQYEHYQSEIDAAFQTGRIREG
jgi:uncharacterized protein YutD